jgi:CopG family transcriptional regulator / antitoxin EndoAI
MSKKVIKPRIVKKIVKIKKNSQFIECSLIEYKEDQLNMDVFEMMKEGYKEMAKINLELSQLPFECENADIDEYENWLCGV